MIMSKAMEQDDEHEYAFNMTAVHTVAKVLSCIYNVCLIVHLQW